MFKPLGCFAIENRSEWIYDKLWSKMKLDTICIKFLSALMTSNCKLVFIQMASLDLLNGYISHIDSMKHCQISYYNSRRIYFGWCAIPAVNHNRRDVAWRRDSTWPMDYPDVSMTSWDSQWNEVYLVRAIDWTQDSANFNACPMKWLSVQFYKIRLVGFIQ